MARFHVNRQHSPFVRRVSPKYLKNCDRDKLLPSFSELDNSNHRELPAIEINYMNYSLSRFLITIY